MHAARKFEQAVPSIPLPLPWYVVTHHYVWKYKDRLGIFIVPTPTCLIFPDIVVK